MSNPYLDQLTSESFLAKKVELLAKLFEVRRQNGEVQTSQDFVASIMEVFSSFHRNIDRPIFHTPRQANAGLSPLSSDISTNFSDIRSDLLLLFAGLEDIESIEIENFNFMQTEANRLLAKLKKISSLTGDLSLYSGNILRDGVFFTDSFTDTSKIDLNSNLLSTDQVLLMTLKELLLYQLIQRYNRLYLLVSHQQSL